MTSSRIEDYALIGDCETAAQVSRTGSIAQAMSHTALVNTAASLTTGTAPARDRG